MNSCLPLVPLCKQSTREPLYPLKRFLLAAEILLPSVIRPSAAHPTLLIQISSGVQTENLETEIVPIGREK